MAAEPQKTSGMMPFSEAVEVVVAVYREGRLPEDVNWEML
jgi:hypothetical protein